MYFKPCQCDRIRFMTVDKLLKGSSPSPPSFFFHVLLILVTTDCSHTYNPPPPRCSLAFKNYILKYVSRGTFSCPRSLQRTIQ
ncbi:hypothetical protein MDV075.91 [Gallid alphaherpesvirus 2]|uniref:Uncharacterized protein n=2 Tax=Gallid alphaherpesvirus 2 TaxID=10390 RepID=Q159J7_9ALPH|nr:hypothetical protein MDV075.91 [Gallid alphaherpesvirus 2]QOJ42107.1 hypothetical protein [synthetic construct]ABR13051.1 hypothetical protein MDV005.5 [Gallid alphaherpesvirus 2]ABR13168.1 hypothetical protein MDV075.91 [Gallid alphaherpesvirus 2]ACF94849.1 hypothetical protein MDV005.5 [Gallid alphaherpesvirus 2]